MTLAQDQLTEASGSNISYGTVFVAFGHYCKDMVSGYSPSSPQPCPEVAWARENVLGKCEQVMVS